MGLFSRLRKRSLRAAGLSQGDARVIGVGVPKTGTSTLGQCFEILGVTPAVGHRKPLAVRARRGDIRASLTEAEHYRGFQDTPWSMLYREMDQHFPGSKFILTTRRDSLARAISAWHHKLRKGEVEGEATEKFLAKHQRLYEAHNTAARRYFEHRPGDLLEVCWENGDGWSELCEFLRLPLPDVPFPHANRGQYGGRTNAAGISPQP